MLMMCIFFLKNAEPFKSFAIPLSSTKKECSNKILYTSLVMGLGQSFLTRVGSIFCGSAWVRSAIYWFGFGFGKFLLKMSNFLIFLPLGQKKYLRVGSKAGQPLSYCKSKVSSSWVGSGPISKNN